MIIKSILDLDLYKLTVAQMVYDRFSNVEIEYTFKCRNAEATDFYNIIRPSDLLEEFNKLKILKLTNEEKKYLQSLGYFSDSFIRWLQDFRFNPSRLVFEKNDDESEPWKLRAKGSWLSVILFETIVLSIVNEIYGEKSFKYRTPFEIHYGAEKIIEKIKYLKENQINLIEFRTRRIFSAEWQEYIFSMLNSNNLISGTSNVNLARKYDSTPIGTMGHEIFMGVQSLYPIQNSQKEIFEQWLNQYKGKLAICLTDTFGDEKFLKDFSFDLAKGYDGVRHDSGCPFEYTDMIVKMYRDFNIDPMFKKIVFSDGLNIRKAIEIEKYCRGKIEPIFGIGTDLTNDVGIKVPSIVMKVTKSNDQPVAKLSADSGKASCEDPLYLKYLIHAIENY